MTLIDRDQYDCQKRECNRPTAQNGKERTISWLTMESIRENASKSGPKSPDVNSVVTQVSDKSSTIPLPSQSALDGSRENVLEFK